MRIAFFGVADYETKMIQDAATTNKLNIELFPFALEEVPDELNLSEYDVVSTASLAFISNSIVDRMVSCKLIALRSVGYNFVNLDYCSQKGIAVTNIRYDSYNVAEFTIMLMLVTLRKAKISICKALVNDFSLEGMIGKELSNATVGIVGTGNIGRKVIKLLSGFGCKVLCYDKYPSGDYDYVDLDTIYQKCDIISFHCPLTKENFHMVGKEELAKMKKGVILINTARGGLLDTEALIDGVESLQIGALALDTIEGENGVSHVDLGAETDGLSAKKNIMYLKQFPNVLITQHYGFFTEEAIQDTVGCTIKNILAYIQEKPLPNQVN